MKPSASHLAPPIPLTVRGIRRLVSQAGEKLLSALLEKGGSVSDNLSGKGGRRQEANAVCKPNQHG